MQVPNSQGSGSLDHNRGPDFIIVGTQKGGTSSLFNCLKQHPDILPASKKEIHYFSQYFDQSMDWYLEHFPERPEGAISGEASPYYLFHPLAAERIAQDFPLCKIIIILRNPTQRAISHYHQQARRGHETLSMAEAFKTEKQRIAKGWQRLLQGESLEGSKVQQCSYMTRGEYLEQILRFEKHFPKQQMLIIESEEFFTQPYPTLNNVFHFLGVDDSFKPADLWPRKPGNYEETPRDIRDYLDHYFSSHNKALFEHLQQTFAW